MQRSFAIGGAQAGLAALSPTSKGGKGSNLDYNSYQREIDGPISPNNSSLMHSHKKYVS